MTSNSEKSTEKLFWFFASALLLFFIYLLRSVLTPFAAGVVIAYLLVPFANRLEKLGLKRWLASSFVLFFVLVVILSLTIFIIPVFAEQTSSLFATLPSFFDIIINKFEPIVFALKEKIGSENIDINKAALSASSYITDIIKWFARFISGLISGGATFLNIISIIFITPFVAFYFIRDWNILTTKVHAMLPRKHTLTINNEIKKIDEILSGYIRGQAYVCITMAIFYSFCLSLYGLDVGLAVGMLSGFLSFVPYVGATLGMVLGTGFAFIQFHSIKSVIITLIIFIAGQFIEGNFLTPKMVGDRTGLHPVWIIFALMAGGALFGFLGIIIAIPVAATIGVIVRFVISCYLKSSIYTGTINAEE